MTGELNLLADDALFDLWAAGDPRAGHVLFRRHFDAVLRFFRRQLGEDVQDLVQTTFLGCVQARERFAHRASFRTYLFTVARNQLFKELRRRARRPDIDFAVSSVQDLAPSPSRALHDREETAQLVEALGRLPVDNQLALYLYYIEDLTAVEIGDVLELAVPAVRSRLRRGLEGLRRHFFAAPQTASGPLLATLDRWEASLPVGDVAEP